jgi:integrase
VTRDGLLIRETKFRKTRLVPLHDTAAAGLRRYLARRRPRSNDDPLFIGKHGGALRYIAVKETFDRLVRKAGIAPTARRRPRLHDLRHSFAVGTLTRWYRLGLDPQTKLLALSTFMGHGDINSTAVYLTPTPELLEHANRRFRAFAATTLGEDQS